ncbi:MAG: flagellar biosynthesis protein FlhA [Legionella sp.]|jgi:flagellar biosynthesis protein FlhA
MKSNTKSELVLIAFACGILMILFIPIPKGLLDLLLIINFSWALTILLLTFYTDKPLSFSTFPALLLISTLFRLALNVSATRLILTDGDAGQVISAMGQYVIHGNYVMGLVVFLILIIVQFIVVTNGSQRVAEVAARFTLDSMPGKQMSIDADLNTGGISQADAKIRRAQVEKEANFYGAMDGANKFVKGDAIAGILIMLVDIIGGFAIGLIQKGLSLSQSIQTYTLLTVGDGLVTQIPALIISTATGIIVTRAATDAHLGTEVARQIGAYPKSLIVVCCGLISLLFLKGIPLVPVVLILSIFIIMTFLALKNQKAEKLLEPELSLYEKISFQPLTINVNPDLYPTLMQHESELLKKIQLIREKVAFELGIIMPPVTFSIDKKLPFPFYQISIYEKNIHRNPLYLDKYLAIRTKPNTKILPGIEVQDPSYGLNAVWIDAEQRTEASDASYTVCEPNTVICSQLNEVVQTHCAELLTRAELENLLTQPATKYLAEELIPSMLSLGQVQTILKNLLQEKVSIRPLTQILEIVLESAKKFPDPTQLSEIVRTGLASSICHKLLDQEQCLQVLTLESSLEQKLNQQLQNKEHLILEPSLTESLITGLAKQVERMLEERKSPILLCSSVLRRHLKRLTQRVIPHLTVLAMSEIPVTVQVEFYAVIH